MKLYDNQYKFFERAYRLEKDLWTDFEDDPAVDFTGKLIRRKNRNARVLDLGCGRGRNSILLAKKGIKVWGIDMIPQALRFARQAAEQEIPHADIHFKKANALHLSFHKDYFDGIIDRGCFHHILKKDWKQYKSNILKILKPSGYFLLVVFSNKSPHLKSKKRNYNVHKGDVGGYYHYDHFFTIPELKMIFPEFQLLYSFIKNEDPYIFIYAIFRKK